MNWIVLPPCAYAEASLPTPAIDGCVGVLGGIADYREWLLPGEAADLGAWVQRRQFEYSSGRHFAHRAMTALGVSPDPVIRMQDRAPIWPEGLTGSIAHCDDLAVALVMRNDRGAGIGVDVERRGRIDPSLFASLFTREEQLAIGRGGSATLHFSAKEAVYKAIYPEVRTFVDFTDVALDFDPPVPSIRYLGDDALVARLMETLAIDWRATSEHVFVVVWQRCPASSPPT
jgi:4'-phosphopantetheinyl transferase EntD